VHSSSFVGILSLFDIVRYVTKFIDTLERQDREKKAQESSSSVKATEAGSPEEGSAAEEGAVDGVGAGSAEGGSGDARDSVAEPSAAAGEATGEGGQGDTASDAAAASAAKAEGEVVEDEEEEEEDADGAELHFRTEIDDVLDDLNHKGRKFILNTRPTDRLCVADAVNEMGARGVGSVLLVDDELLPLGVFSATDYVSKVVVPGLDPTSICVDQVANMDFAVVTSGDTVLDVARCLTDKGQRHAVVVDEDGAILGMVSLGDVARALMPSINTTPPARQIWNTFRLVMPTGRGASA
jgi:CBS domain-containing protein